LFILSYGLNSINNSLVAAFGATISVLYTTLDGFADLHISKAVFKFVAFEPVKNVNVNTEFRGLVAVELPIETVGVPIIDTLGFKTVTLGLLTTEVVTVVVLKLN
jgi:hypothetical protein